eukprot:GILJ01011910.1.p1 GENE.GILJ01011910.1~~GILJ01011910.1.p1  ORF type:complete len:616 (+),score=72.67 GILJ01011910.1:182-2029(+)
MTSGAKSGPFVLHAYFRLFHCGPICMVPEEYRNSTTYVILQLLGQAQQTSLIATQDHIWINEEFFFEVKFESEWTETSVFEFLQDEKVHIEVVQVLNQPNQIVDGHRTGEYRILSRWQTYVRDLLFETTDFTKPRKLHDRTVKMNCDLDDPLNEIHSPSLSFSVTTAWFDGELTLVPESNYSASGDKSLKLSTRSIVIPSMNHHSRTQSISSTRSTDHERTEEDLDLSRLTVDRTAGSSFDNFLYGQSYRTVSEVESFLEESIDSRTDDQMSDTASSVERRITDQLRSLEDDISKDMEYISHLSHESDQCSFTSESGSGSSDRCFAYDLEYVPVASDCFFMKSHVPRFDPVDPEVYLSKSNPIPLRRVVPSAVPSKTSQDDAMITKNKDSGRGVSIASKKQERSPKKSPPRDIHTRRHTDVTDAVPNNDIQNLRDRIKALLEVADTPITVPTRSSQTQRSTKTVATSDKCCHTEDLCSCHLLLSRDGVNHKNSKRRLASDMSYDVGNMEQDGIPFHKLLTERVCKYVPYAERLRKSESVKDWNSHVNRSIDSRAEKYGKHKSRNEGMPIGVSPHNVLGYALPYAEPFKYYTDYLLNQRSAQQVQPFQRLTSCNDD